MKNDFNDTEFSTKLLNKIKALDGDIWKSGIDNVKIENWIKSIVGDEANFKFLRIQLLYLLSHFIFFGIREIRELLKTLFKDLIEYRLIEAIRDKCNNDFELDSIEKELEMELKKTRFVSLGNPSESSSLILYFFRQATKLDRALFINQNEIFHQNQSFVEEIKDTGVKRYIFIDDFCGGGTQAKRYSQETLKKVRKLNQRVELVYLSVIGTKKGIEALKNMNLFSRVESYYTIDESYKAFSDVSRFYNDSRDKISKIECEKIVKKMGDLLNPGEPMGKDNGQLLFSFFYNTPNNTLPIFWKSSEKHDYEPIFYRYEKNYGEYFS